MKLSESVSDAAAAQRPVTRRSLPIQTLLRRRRRKKEQEEEREEEGGGEREEEGVFL